MHRYIFDCITLYFFIQYPDRVFEEVNIEAKTYINQEEYGLTVSLQVPLMANTVLLKSCTFFN